MAKDLRFDSEEDAGRALKSCGFSLGRMQRDNPRGVMVGDWDIPKWRNLSGKEKGELHGQYKRWGRGGHVIVTLSRNCPTDAKTALEDLAV